MANNNWNNYTEKTATPVDADEVMVRDSADGKNKKLLFGTFWKWVAKKLNEATISELQTSNKTIVGALNQLNSDSFSSFCTYGGTYEITSRLVYNTYIVFGMYSLDAIFSIITVNGDATPVLKEFASTGYIRAELVSKGKFNLILQNTSVAIRVIAMDSCTIVNKG